MIDGVFTTVNSHFNSFDEAKSYISGISGHHSLKIFNDDGELVHIDSPAEAGLVTLDVPASLSITVN
jgi:hypothetical protein